MVLSYKVNDKKEFIAHNDVLREDGLNYRFAVTTRYVGTQVQLV